MSPKLCMRACGGEGRARAKFHALEGLVAALDAALIDEKTVAREMWSELDDPFPEWKRNDGTVQ